MTDIGFYLVVAYLFLAPWLVRALRAPGSLAWPAFILGILLLVLWFLDDLHLWLPSGVAGPLTVVLMVAILCRLATELFPRDRASLP
jgi:uncharacterized membrane protein AbrB (regulator of aidB expression)